MVATELALLLSQMNLKESRVLLARVWDSPGARAVTMPLWKDGVLIWRRKV
jgi:hypothetical protein